jgi:hypothetical protein
VGGQERARVRDIIVFEAAAAHIIKIISGDENGRAGACGLCGPCFIFMSCG